QIEVIEVAEVRAAYQVRERHPAFQAADVAGRRQVVARQVARQPQRIVGICGMEGVGILAEGLVTQKVGAGIQRNAASRDNDGDDNISGVDETVVVEVVNQVHRGQDARGLVLRK